MTHVELYGMEHLSQQGDLDTTSGAEDIRMVLVAAGCSLYNPYYAIDLCIVVEDHI